MAQERNTMPMSTAGLVRYMEESKEAIKLKPEHIIIVSVVITVAELYLRFFPPPG